MFNSLTQEQQYLGLFLLALLLLRLPRIGKFFRVVNTLFHENGHALLVLLTSGKVERVDLNADTSGSCTYRPKNRIAEFLVVLAGYPISSLSAFAMFWCLHNGKTDCFLYGFAGVLVWNLLFWVRKQFGVLWILSMGLLLFLCYYLDNPLLSYYFLFFIAALNLIESIYSTFVILYISAENPQQAGDARSLRLMTFIPAIVWALLFVVQSLWFGLVVVKLLFGISILPI